MDNVVVQSVSADLCTATSVADEKGAHSAFRQLSTLLAFGHHLAMFVLNRLFLLGLVSVLASLCLAQNSTNVPACGPQCANDVASSVQCGSLYVVVLGAFQVVPYSISVPTQHAYVLPM